MTEANKSLDNVKAKAAAGIARASTFNDLVAALEESLAEAKFARSVSVAAVAGATGSPAGASAPPAAAADWDGQPARLALFTRLFDAEGRAAAEAKKAKESAEKKQKADALAERLKRAASDDDFKALLEQVKQTAERKLTPLGLQETLKTRYLKATQAYTLIAAIQARPDIKPLESRKSFIFEHVVFCRVVDRHNLRAGYGCEGYYAEDHLPETYEVVDHQRSFLW